MNLGEVLSSVGSIGNQNLTKNLGGSNAVVGDSFSDVLKNAVEDVNSKQVKSYEAMENMASGNVENLQQAVQQIKKAEMSLKLGLEVKNKALGAYKQVMAMQV